MFENEDFYNMFNNMSSNVTTETESLNQATPNMANQQQTFDRSWDSSNYQDDYSVTPNYQSQSNYNSFNQNYGAYDNSVEQGKQATVVRQMETPIIQMQAPAVTLTKTKQKIRLSARMKVALSMFIIIVSSLIMAIAYNFAGASKLQNGFAEKQVQIQMLTQSINTLKAEYNSVSNDEAIKESAKQSGYVETNETNVVEVDLSDYYSESVIEELPSNWFNDVCEFLSGIFS